jgi:signal transduction histidine kinase
VGITMPDGRTVEIHPGAGFVDEVFREQRYLPVDSIGSLTDTVRTGQPLWIESQEAYIAAYPMHEQTIRHHLRSQAAAALPLITHGRVIGALLISSPVPRRFTAEDRRFLLTLAHHCAQAIERARLYEAEHAARNRAEQVNERLEQLQAITSALSEALTPLQVAEVIVQKGFDALGSHLGTVALREADMLQVLHQRGYTPEVHREHERIPITASTPLSDAVRTGKSIWLHKASEYEERYPHLFSSLHPRTQTQAMACVPMAVSGRVIGGVGISFLQPQPFYEEDRKFIEALAQQGAQALERARLTQEAKEAAAAAAAHEERQRLARDLHDAVSQTLFSATTFAETLPSVWQRKPERAVDQLGQIVTLNRAAMAEMRTLLLELRPEAIIRTSLPKLFQQLLDAAKGRKQIETALIVEGSEVVLEPDVHVAFYRIAQESVNNALKHSRATTLTIHLLMQPETIHVTIQDNGHGFDAAQLASGLGLNSMRERAAAIGALLTVQTQPGQGTEISVKWDVERNAGTV